MLCSALQLATPTGANFCSVMMLRRARPDRRFFRFRGSVPASHPAPVHSRTELGMCTGQPNTYSLLLVACLLWSYRTYSSQMLSTTRGESFFVRVANPMQSRCKTIHLFLCNGICVGCNNLDRVSTLLLQFFSKIGTKSFVVWI